MSPVAGHFDFPEYSIPLVPYKGQKREAKQSIRCVKYGYAMKTTPNSVCDMVLMMVFPATTLCKLMALNVVRPTINKLHYDKIVIASLPFKAQLFFTC